MYTIKHIKPVESKLTAFGFDEQKIQRELSFALSIINNNNKLQQCSEKSILGCIVTAANLGLTLNPQAQECALIPRKGTATLMPMYQGIANLAYKSGNIKQLITVEVREKDSFQLKPHNNQEPVEHSFGFGERGEVVGYYTLIIFSDSSKQVETMDIKTVMKVREMSDGYKYAREKEQHPWGKWFGEMARKACLKRALKYVNKTKAPKELLDIIELDNQYYVIQGWQVNRINNLLETSTLDSEQRFKIEEDLFGLSASAAAKVIENLEANQLPNHVGYNDRVGKKQLYAQVAESVENEKT